MKTILSILVALALVGCEKSVNLHALQKTEVNYEDLHLRVKNAYKSCFKTFVHEDGRVTYNWVEHNSICIEDGSSFEDFSDHGKSGVRPYEYRFRIDGYVFKLGFNGNREKAPFVFHQNKLYYGITWNIGDQYDLEHSKLEYIDLSEYLE